MGLVGALRLPPPPWEEPLFFTNILECLLPPESYLVDVAPMGAVHSFWFRGPLRAAPLHPIFDPPAFSLIFDLFLAIDSSSLSRCQADLSCCSISLNPHNTPQGMETIVSLFYRWGSRGWETCNRLRWP